MDQIPNTNSTICSQLFEYQIIQIIRSNPDLKSKWGGTIFLVANLQQIKAQAYIHSANDNACIYYLSLMTATPNVSINISILNF